MQNVEFFNVELGINSTLKNSPLRHWNILND